MKKIPLLGIRFKYLTINTASKKIEFLIIFTSTVIIQTLNYSLIILIYPLAKSSMYLCVDIRGVQKGQSSNEYFRAFYFSSFLLTSSRYIWKTICYFKSVYIIHLYYLCTFTMIQAYFRHITYNFVEHEYLNKLTYFVIKIFQ